MSLLEDVFLQDEASEAQELERIIEGDEYDERPRPSSPDSGDNSEKEDEAEEGRRRVEPTSAKPKRIIKNPRVVLNPARLTGPRGIHIIPEHFKDFKFKGKGHEKEDLDLVLKKLEHWAYRLFPKFEFADCLKKIETLGTKRPVVVHLTKIRSDQFVSEDLDTVIQRDSSDDEAPQPVQEEDEFDKLLQQQIDLARATPAPGSSTRKPVFSTPMDKSLIMPKAISSPSISDEMRERMLRNRQLAEERRIVRLKRDTSETNTNFANNVSQDSDTVTIIDNALKDVSKTRDINTREDVDNVISDQNMDEDDVIKVMNNRSHVIDISDEDDALVVNESITVDVHDSRRNDENGIDTDKDEQNKNTIAKTQNNRSNVIGSSDEDDALVNESITVDVHVSHKNYEKNIDYDIDNQNKNTIAKVQNIIDSSDEEDALVINESIAINDHDSYRKVDGDEERNSNKDNQNGNTNSKVKNNVSNAIDSSDEDDASATNDAITVVVLDSQINNKNCSDDKNIVCEDTVTTERNDVEMTAIDNVNELEDMVDVDFDDDF